ncbi:MAG TPA: hypothetical protein VEK08_01155 [Planctomycetota bacterium]|nr:hypothetical protein [Planctomycetota bacterium]
MRELYTETPQPFSQAPGDKNTLVERVSTLRRQYLRAREYCGFTLDELINDRKAQQCLREVWLVGCMVRKPQKANRLPPGNPFR